MAHKSIKRAAAVLALVLSCAEAGPSQGPPALKASQVPLFSLRAQVAKTGGHAPTTQSFIFSLNTGKQKVSARSDAWSPWLEFSAADAEAALQVYSNRSRGQFPVMLWLGITPVVDPTLVNVQIRFPGPDSTFDLHGDLFGPSLGIMVWRDANTNAPRAATMAGYNQRYWHEFDAAALPASQRPKNFLIVDRFIGGDADRLDWQEGISHLAEIGITAMIVPPTAPLRDMLLENGIRRIALGGGIVDGPLGIGTTTADIEKWSSGFAANYFKANFQPGDFSQFALADEPGWYYPSAMEAVDKNPAALRIFQHYLADQHLTPAMLGAAYWGQVHPIGRSRVTQGAPLAARRLFYWTCRFFPWYAAEYMREGTDELHRAFTPDLKTFSNWNNFAGQYYFEGFPANNPNPQSPDAAMAAPDWFESGRMKATDFLWTEDWFGNNRAWEWSFYASKLRSIAYKNDLQFGAYIVGRSAGEPLDGFLQKVLTLIGGGAKAVFYYNFGPEYNFPGNSYSEVPGAAAQFAHADKMIAEAEDVLWPGREPQAQVAILQPRSSEVWDGLHIPPGSRVLGVTNNELNNQNLDYIAEEFDEYVALEMSDIPVDFVSEDGLTDGTLAKYKVLYITEPDIPSEGQKAIARWVRNGGTLAMVPGAAQADRYDESANILTLLAGSPPHQRTYIWYAPGLKSTGMIGNSHTFGERSEPTFKGKPVVLFNDHTPAVYEGHVEAGNIIYFSYFPGLSYGRLVLDNHLGLQRSAEADSLRSQVLTPVRVAHVSPAVQVSASYVETPMLVSSAGAAITLLNWTGGDLSSVRVTVREPFRIGTATSVTHGPIRFQRQGDVVAFSLPLGAADVVKLTQ
ncbi:MAG: hypothetical protein EPN47_18755 [Acidobacteria bacterium]|nr:MAG: hypothetical protein EPN47_18755 [Acidobacteriota bacterium]